MTPTTSDVGAGSSDDAPTSHPRVDLEVNADTLRDATVGRRRARAERPSPPRCRCPTAAPMTRMRAFRSAARSWSASGSVATQRALAPASRAAFETSTAPCPYPSALTTAHSSAPSAARNERRGVPPYRAEVEGEARPLHAVILSAREPAGAGRAGRSRRALRVRREHRRVPVCDRRGSRSRRRIEPFREERRHDTRQDVSRAGRRERGRTPRRRRRCPRREKRRSCRDP